MRSTRRRILNIAGMIFLASLLTRIVFLITGLRTYATRPEIPFRIAEMAIVLLAALFTYFFSYRYGFLLMAASCLTALYAPIRELISGSHITIGSVYTELGTADYLYDILLIVGMLVMGALSVMTCPGFPREKKQRHLIRLFSAVAVLIFAALLIYQVYSLAKTLMAEAYPGQYITKYYYVSAATDFAMILTGIACLMTAGIRPSEHHRKPEEAEKA